MEVCTHFHSYSLNLFEVKRRFGIISYQKSILNLECRLHSFERQLRDTKQQLKFVIMHYKIYNCTSSITPKQEEYVATLVSLVIHQCSL